MKRVSILSTILIPLVLIGISFILALTLLYNSLEKLYTYQKKLIDDTVPSLSETFSVTGSFNKVRSNLYRIMSEHSKLAYLSELESTRNQLLEIKLTLLEMEEIPVYKEQTEKLSTRINRLNNIVNEVQRFLIQRTFIMEKRQRNIKKLRFLAEKLQLLSYDSTLDDKSSIILSQNTIAHLIILCSDINIFYNLKIIKEVKKNIQVFKEALKNNTIQDNDIRKRIEAIIILAEERNGIFSLFEDFNAIQNQIISVSIQLETLSAEIDSVSNFLLEQIHINTINNSDILEQNILYLYYFISITGICIIIVSLIAYKFITSLLITPLLALNKSLDLRSQGIKKEVLHTGAYEIQKISNAVTDFILQIEEREQKLQDSHNNLESKVIERTSKISTLSNKIIKIQENERFKLAAELHDDIGASIGVIKFSIERALKMLDIDSTTHAQTSLVEAVDVVKSVARQLRRIQTDLRPPYLDIGLLKTLEWFVFDYNIAFPEIDTQADFFFDDAELAPTLQIVIFRIIQEALNNISKYSQATKVTIQVTHEEELSVLIIDNGRGFLIEDLQNTHIKSSGHGIRNIQERVTISSGHFSITSSPGKGTSVHAIWTSDVLNP